MQPAEKKPDELCVEIILVEDREPPSAGGRTADPRWKVLVVDDDCDVQLATRHLLGHAQILGRQLELIEAVNSQAAKSELLQHPDVAVILLDVVMEEHDSGLKLARWIRKAGLSAPRIVLRTGQPGYTPVLDIVRNYDVNDYQLKSDLTQTKLLLSLTLAIRSFEQIAKLIGGDPRTPSL